jgi:hypothetical protein
LFARRETDPKHVYYLSAEFLMGRTLTNAVNNLGLKGEYAEVGAAPLPHFSLWVLRSRPQPMAPRRRSSSMPLWRKGADAWHGSQRSGGGSCHGSCHEAGAG